MTKQCMCLHTACSQHKLTSLVCNSKDEGDAVASSECLASQTHSDVYAQDAWDIRRGREGTAGGGPVNGWHA